MHSHEHELPGVDIFVCTADPVIEPPAMVISTVLSVLAYDYPTEKLAVYLSDDAGSELTYYALLEASLFAKHWLPFCRKFKVQPTSPAAYFKSFSESHVDHGSNEEFQAIQVNNFNLLFPSQGLDFSLYFHFFRVKNNHHILVPPFLLEII